MEERRRVIADHQVTNSSKTVEIIRCPCYPNEEFITPCTNCCPTYNQDAKTCKQKVEGVCCSDIFKYTLCTSLVTTFAALVAIAGLYADRPSVAKMPINAALEDYRCFNKCTSSNVCYTYKCMLSLNYTCENISYLGSKTVFFGVLNPPNYHINETLILYVFNTTCKTYDNNYKDILLWFIGIPLLVFISSLTVPFVIIYIWGCFVTRKQIKLASEKTNLISSDNDQQIYNTMYEHMDEDY